MTPQAGPVVASISIIVLYGIPVPRMGTDHQPGVRTGAVALEADIAVAVAGLARLQIAARLAGMVR